MLLLLLLLFLLLECRSDLVELFEKERFDIDRFALHQPKESTHEGVSWYLGGRNETIATHATLGFTELLNREVRQGFELYARTFARHLLSETQFLRLSWLRCCFVVNEVVDADVF